MRLPTRPTHRTSPCTIEDPAALATPAHHGTTGPASMCTLSARPPVAGRRRLLRALIAAPALGLPWLGGCGEGGADTAGPPPAQDALQTDAHRGVDRGLVALALADVRASEAEVRWAGRRRLGADDPVQSGDAWAVGSITKAMSSATIAALVDQGQLDWQQPLASLVPDWASGLHPDWATLNLTHLLDHSAGLPAFDGSADDEAQLMAAVLALPEAQRPADLRGRRQWLAHHLLARPPVEGHGPGGPFLYSNAGYAVAAAAVEAVTDTAFERLMQTLLMAPLGLQGAWRHPMPVGDETVQGHEGTAGALQVVTALEATPEERQWLEVLAPAGHWSTPAADLARWLQWHLRAFRAEATPLPASYLRALLDGDDTRYLRGWQRVRTTSRTVLTHDGHEPGFMCRVLMDTAGERALAALSNTGHMAADGSSWVLQVMDEAMASVLARGA